MLRRPPGQVMNLLSARDSRRDDLDGITGRFLRRRLAPIADLRRQIVVLFFEAEGARHAAAAGVDFTDVVAGGFEHRDRRRRADQRFLMTMSVQQYFFAAAV